MHNARDAVIRRVNRYLVYFGDEYMKRGLQMAKQKKVVENYEGYKMIDVRLSSDDLEKAKIWIQQNSDDYELAFTEPAIDGYKVSITWSEKQKLYYVSYTGKPEHPLNAKHTITSKAEDVFTAAMLNYYKTAILFDWETWVAVDRDDDRFG